MGRLKTYKGAKAKADLLFSKVIRSQNLCEAESYGGRRCAGRLEAAHIISRRFSAIRTDTRNAFCLCSAHHRRFHDFPREFSRFVSGTWAAEYYDRIEEKAQPAKFKGSDWEERINFLKRIDQGEITIKQAREQED